MLYLIVHIVPHVPKIWFAGINLKLNCKKLSLWVPWAWQLRVLQKKYFSRHAGFPFYLQCRNRLTCMNSQRSSNELTKEFKWTHKEVQMNTQRSSNEPTKTFKWTHKGVQMSPQRTSNDLQVARDIAIHRILTIDYHFCSIVPYPLQHCDACSWLQCLTRTLYLQILSSLVRNLKVESWSADLKGNCTVNIFLSICLRLNFMC